MLQALYRARDIVLLSIDQCEFGSPSKAPTTLICLRAPRMLDIAASKPRGGRCSHGPDAHIPLKGRDAQGAWRTAIKRAYRPPLCQAMAEALLHGQGGQECCAGSMSREEMVAALPEGLRAFAQPLDEEADLEADHAYPDLAGPGLERSLRREQNLQRKKKFMQGQLRLQDEFLAGVLLAHEQRAQADAADQATDDEDVGWNEPDAELLPDSPVSEEDVFGHGHTGLG